MADVEMDGAGRGTRHGLLLWEARRKSSGDGVTVAISRPGPRNPCSPLSHEPHVIPPGLDFHHLVSNHQSTAALR
jgi:hypothetical protein